VFWDKVAVSTSPLQETLALPPALDDATVRSYDADVSVKLPPVELDRVTMTLVAFTWTESAREPARMVNVAAGDAREMVAFEL
jgi:hypothetical protein